MVGRKYKRIHVTDSRRNVTKKFLIVLFSIVLSFSLFLLIWSNGLKIDSSSASLSFGWLWQSNRSAVIDLIVEESASRGSIVSIPVEGLMDNMNKIEDNFCINPHKFNYILNPGKVICSRSDEGKPLFLVYIHSAPSHYSRRMLIRETWGSQNNFEHVDVRTIFMCGAANNSRIQSALEMEYERYGDLVQEDFVDSYRNLTHKAVMALKWVSRNCRDARLVLKADDDIFINIFRLLPHIESILNQKELLREPLDRLIICNVWNQMKVIRDPSSKWYISREELPDDYFKTYCSGSLYAFTPAMAGSLFEVSRHVPFFWVDDYYVTGMLPEKMQEAVSAEELLAQSKRSSELPGRGGMKDQEPDNSWLQKKKVENFHEERQRVLSEERVERLSALSTGIWDPERGKVIVTKNRGKFWKNMGHCIGGEKLLYPEEAVFLVDQGVMEVSHEGCPMSLQEVYYRLLPTDKSFDNYVFSSHLMRVGFIVRRAETDTESESLRSEMSSLAEGEPMVNSNDDDQVDAKKPRRHNVGDDRAKKRQREGSDCICGSNDRDCEGDDMHTNPDAKKLKSSGDLSADQFFESPRAKSPEDRDLNICRSGNDSLSAIDVLEMEKDKASIDPRSLSRALPDLELTRPLEFDLTEERKVMRVIAKDCFESAKQPNSNGVENWGQWKKLTRKEKVFLTRAKVLWEDEGDDDDDVVRPLYDPDIICSPAETMRRIRRSQKNDSGELSKIVGNPPEHDSSLNMLEVFQPDSKFKKSNPGRPLACAVTVRADSRPPLDAGALRLIETVHRRAGGSLMFGVVEGGEASFFSCSLVDLPTLV